MPEKPGILVEIDTIHEIMPSRLYVYTLLDVCSRWAYAIPSLRISTHHSLGFVERARESAPFSFSTIQSDHGSEFSKWFTKRIVERGMSHRHSRIRTPNDNAHLERFNRTLQDECLRHVPYSLRSWQKEIPEYLEYYNTKRAHMGLDMKTPTEILKAIPSY
jgi:transposase InsO family protein